MNMMKGNDMTLKIETAAMVYGKRFEDIALREYKKLFPDNCEIKKVGLIILLSQPWLCCSPDAIRTYGSNIWEKRLVEIKCPAKCKKTPVFEKEKGVLNVSYLKCDENGIYLKENHSIYTQIQVQMYVTNISHCDLFIYSPKGSVLLTIPRNNELLSNLIPHIEKFYFITYLPKLYDAYNDA